MSKQNEKNNINAVQGYGHQRGRSSSTTLKDSQNHNELSNSSSKVYISILKRKAIDLIGRVGYQYDACQDKVVKNFRLLENSSTRAIIDIPPSCIIIKGEMANDDTLLKILDIDDQSILNLLVNTTDISINGTHVALFNSRQWYDNRKRILFYRKIYEKETLPLQPKWNYLEDYPLHQNATHIITSISSGIELLIVLEVPIELSIQDVDEKLYKLCLIFRTGRRLADHDTVINYLDQLKIMIIYTNVTKLLSLKSISAVYERICKFKIRYAQPIFYSLQLISSIYHQVNIIYRRINYGIIYNVQSELLTLRYLIDGIHPLLTTCNKSKFHQQYEELKQRYILSQQSLNILIRDIQRGRKHEHELAEYFIRTNYRSLIIDIEKLIVNIQQLSSSSHSPSSSSSKSSSISLQNSIKTTDINVLLLGETGVGKSTFINALANYIQFESLKQVGENDPIVLIPTSFLVTTRTIKRSNTRITDFNEITIRFGKPDPNELHNDQGQSVTQQCKSYSIPINDHIKLNMIDTPGIGDTRGLKQDEINIQNISSFIQKLNHLNAICILLKPNVERLHASFRLYLIQLFNMLHPRVRKNIIFCFTNARSTLYMPGNTVPLLDELLKQLPGDRVIFNSSNTFCFDSESFRFLAAMKQGIKFSEQQDREYQQSWVRSATETNRFYKYIQSLTTCWINTNDKLIQELPDTTSCLF